MHKILKITQKINYKSYLYILIYRYYFAYIHYQVNLAVQFRDRSTLGLWGKCHPPPPITYFFSNY